MNEAKTRAKIKELHAVAVQWAARADRDAAHGDLRSAQQHLRKANLLALEAIRLEMTTLTAD